jgi:hypothetical protein
METTHMTNATSTGWEAKAHRIIAAECLASYLQTNTRPDGQRYRRHRPYAVPATAEALVRCLGTNDEAGAKAIFLRIAAGVPGAY